MCRYVPRGNSFLERRRNQRHRQVGSSANIAAWKASFHLALACAARTVLPTFLCPNATYPVYTMCSTRLSLRRHQPSEVLLCSRSCVAKYARWKDSDSGGSYQRSRQDLVVDKMSRDILALQADHRVTNQRLNDLVDVLTEIRAMVSTSQRGNS